MHLGGIFVILIVLTVVAVIAWNFVPGIKQKLSGWTTLLEGGLSVLYMVFGAVTGAIQDAQAAGFLPPWLVQYGPWIIIVWLLFKRIRTTEPVGVKKKTR